MNANNNNNNVNTHVYGSDNWNEENFRYELCGVDGGWVRGNHVLGMVTRAVN